MPDLGIYAVEILAAYGLSVGLLVLLIGVSVRRARKVRARLEQIETRRETRHV